MLSKVKQTNGTGPFGVTYPILRNDGSSSTTQTISASARMAQVSFTADGDQQNYITLNKNGVTMTRETAVQTSYGDVTPIRAETSDTELDTFVYPRNGSDPSASSCA